MEIEKGANIICQLFNSPYPCLIGRFGTIECQALFNLDGKGVLEKNAGIFGSPNDILLWKQMYKESFFLADCLALGWFFPTKHLEEKVLKEIGWNGHCIPLRSLEPYYVLPENYWTNCLENKKVCVVSSFANTASKQIQNPFLWKTPIWPSSIQWCFVKTGYSPSLAQGRAGWSELSDIESWKDAYEYIVEEVLKTGAEIVLIGCGGLGMVIGAELKKRGKKCIVLGGAVQVLMGIKGRRWETHSVISNLWNEHWVWPSEDETPGCAKDVERSCYWN